MTDILLGLIAAVAGVLLFLLGYLFGEMSGRNPPPTALVPIYTAKEMEEMKQRNLEDQKAFTSWSGYNASVAYAMNGGMNNE